MNEQATKKKITRSYVRGLLEQLKDLGIDTVTNDHGEIPLSLIEGQSDEVTIGKAVGVLIAEAPK